MGAAGRLVIRADAARGRGVQHLTDRFMNKSASIEVVVVGHTAYVRGGRSGLEDPALVGLRRAEASRYAGRWISIPSTDRLYGGLATAVTFRSFLRQIEPASHSRFRAVSTMVEGTKALEIRALSKYGELDVVSRGAGRLPVRAVQIAAGGMGGTTMSRWNEPVRVQTPANAVPIAVVRR
jgi:hypothetical protein